MKARWPTRDFLLIGLFVLMGQPLAAQSQVDAPQANRLAQTNGQSTESETSAVAQSPTDAEQGTVFRLTDAEFKGPQLNAASDQETLPPIRPDAPLTLRDPFADDPLGDDLLADDLLTDDPLDESIRPRVLRDPDEPAQRLPLIGPGEDHTNPLFVIPSDMPYGFTGPSGVLPTESQQSSHFIPVEDRWRLGQQNSDRYGKGHPIMDDYPGVKGAWWDPYNQNVLKGDYPIFGQHTFLNITGVNLSLFEARQLPTPTTPFEATRNPGAAGFFGDPDSFTFINQTQLAVDLFHGNTFFKPADWRIKFDLIYNVNAFVADELAIVSPNVLDGTSRYRDHLALEEWFVEAKLADTSPYYDFASVRAGSQLFVSDFRGFIFNDINRGVRLFGTRNNNRDQFNLVWFDQMEKDTNSLLNRIEEDRHQNTVIANYYRQDFLYPGYNVNVSFHYNRDKPSIEFDRNNFLVRPDPVGVAAPHDVRSYYFGTASNGHIERINVSSAFYYVMGRDDLNPLAGREVNISAYMAALELSYDRDWVRFRTSYFFNSGDSDPNDSRATGFDAIFTNPNFAGQEFSYWGRQAIRLFGVELTNREALGASLRNTKFQGQTNFVNPGLHLFNLGLDADITPRLKTINNVNFLWFDKTQVLETYLFVGEVEHYIGADISTGLEYRPLLNNNIEILGGFSTLISGSGSESLFQNLAGETNDPVAGFLEVILEY